MPCIDSRPSGMAGRACASRASRAPRSPLARRLAATALALSAACAVADPGQPVPATAPAAAPAAAAQNVVAGAQSDAAPGLRAHAIVYRAAFKGMGAGSLELTLRHETVPGTWVYETRAYPSFLASFVINPRSRERSAFGLDAAGRVAPHHYRLDDGTPEHRDDVELSYDRTHGRVTGRARGTAFELPLEPGTQDAMSIRLAVSVDLLAGRDPADYPMIDGSELKHFVYRRVGHERIHTALGQLDTVVYTSERRGAGPRDRTWRYWYAPALDWLPVRIEQREDGRARFEFELRSLKWL